MNKVFKPKNSYSKADLVDCGFGQLFGEGNGRLPIDPMLMFDRITKINDTGGKYSKGEVYAELDVNPDLWFFDCHFKEDPVICLLYTSPSPRDLSTSRMPSSA